MRRYTGANAIPAYWPNSLVDCSSHLSSNSAGTSERALLYTRYVLAYSHPNHAKLIVEFFYVCLIGILLYPFARLQKSLNASVHHLFGVSGLLVHMPAKLVWRAYCSANLVNL